MRSPLLIPLLIVCLVASACGGEDTGSDDPSVLAIDEAESSTTESTEVTVPPATRSSAPTTEASSPLVTLDASPGTFELTTVAPTTTAPTVGEDGEDDTSDDGETTTTEAPGPWSPFDDDPNPVAFFRISPSSITSQVPGWPGSVYPDTATACIDGSSFEPVRKSFSEGSSAVFAFEGERWLFLLLDPTDPRYQASACPVPEVPEVDDEEVGGNKDDG